jgi:hypothetical protein
MLYRNRFIKSEMNMYESNYNRYLQRASAGKSNKITRFKDKKSVLTIKNVSMRKSLSLN